MTVEFSDERKAHGEYVTFVGTVNGKRAAHRIADTTLHDFCYWNLDPDTRVAAFDAYRQGLEEVIRRKLAAGESRNEFGGVDLLPDDIRQRGEGFDWRPHPATSRPR
jgi:hypothetical protein